MTGAGIAVSVVSALAGVLVGLIWPRKVTWKLAASDALQMALSLRLQALKADRKTVILQFRLTPLQLAGLDQFKRFIERLRDRRILPFLIAALLLALTPADPAEASLSMQLDNRMPPALGAAMAEVDRTSELVDDIFQKAFNPNVTPPDQSVEGSPAVPGSREAQESEAHWTELTPLESPPQQPGPKAIIREVFGPAAPTALRVFWCESRYLPTARNGQYLGVAQMGRNERAAHGHGPTIRQQVEAAYSLYSARGWQPWRACL